MTSRSLSDAFVFTYNNPRTDSSFSLRFVAAPPNGEFRPNYVQILGSGSQFSRFTETTFPPLRRARLGTVEKSVYAAAVAARSEIAGTVSKSAPLVKAGALTREGLDETIAELDTFIEKANEGGRKLVGARIYAVLSSWNTKAGRTALEAFIKTGELPFDTKIPAQALEYIKTGELPKTASNATHIDWKKIGRLSATIGEMILAEQTRPQDFEPTTIRYHETVISAVANAFGTKSVQDNLYAQALSWAQERVGKRDAKKIADVIVGSIIDEMRSETAAQNLPRPRHYLNGVGAPAPAQGRFATLHA